jgi:hypothetical protein
MTGYFANPSGYTWQTLGVPAGATVTQVQGGWYDKVTTSILGCASATAGLQIFNSTNSTELTSLSIFSNTDVSGDTGSSGATHTGSTVNVIAGQTASSAISLHFNVNPAANGLFSGCNIFGDNLQLVISYTLPSGRKGQTIVAFNRTPDGDFVMRKTFGLYID